MLTMAQFDDLPPAVRRALAETSFIGACPFLNITSSTTPTTIKAADKACHTGSNIDDGLGTTLSTVNCILTLGC